MTTRRFLFDVSGLLHWYAYFRHSTGIPRVIERLATAAPSQGSTSVEFVVRGLGGHKYYRLNRDVFAGLAEPSRRDAAVSRLRRRFATMMQVSSLSGLAQEARWYHLPYLALGLSRLDGLVEAALVAGWPQRRGPIVAAAPPGPRDVLFHPGDLHWQRSSAPWLVALRRQTGVRLVTLVHDLFVFERPDWFDARLVESTRRGLSVVAPAVDRWVANSGFVRDHLEMWIGERGLPSRPIGVMPMGWDGIGAEVGAKASAATLARLGLEGRPFILSIGTVEPRKNFDALLDAYASLRDSLGARAPDLVVVGGGGWHSTRVKARLRRSSGVRWLRAARDDDLVVLYRQARFSVVPSFSEGWGLPVQESLAHGLPCLASNGGALPEASRGLTRLFDPLDKRGLEAAMKHWILDADALSAMRRRIAVDRLARPGWKASLEWLIEFGFADMAGA